LSDYTGRFLNFANHLLCRCVVPLFQRVKTSVLLECWDVEPSPFWHMWPLQRERFVVWLGAKVEWFCLFQGFFLCLKTYLMRH